MEYFGHDEYKSTYHDFVPLIVYVLLDGLNLALVSILPGSLPWLGSVRPKAPTISPLAAINNTKESRLHHKTRIIIGVFAQGQIRCISPNGL